MKPLPRTLPIDVGACSPRVYLLDMLIRYGEGSDNPAGLSLANRVSIRAGLGSLTREDLESYRALCPVYGSGFSIRRLVPGKDRQGIDSRAYALFDGQGFHPLFNGGSSLHPFATFNVVTPFQAEMSSNVDMQALAATLDGPSNVYTVAIDGVWFGPAQSVAVKRFGPNVAGSFPKVNTVAPVLGLGSKLFGFEAVRFEEEE